MEHMHTHTCCCRFKPPRSSLPLSPLCPPSLNVPALDLMGLIKQKHVHVKKNVHKRETRHGGLNHQRQLLPGLLRLGLPRRSSRGRRKRTRLQRQPSSFLLFLSCVSFPRPGTTTASLPTATTSSSTGSRRSGRNRRRRRPSSSLGRRGGSGRGGQTTAAPA